MFAKPTLIEYGTGILYLKDLNEKIDSGEIGDIILFSEAMQSRMIADLADEIALKEKRIVLIAGPSSSGKTSFSKRLCTQLWICGKKPIYLGTDDYFLARERMVEDENGNVDFESLSALDLDLFNHNMRDLLDGKTVDIPRFDFLSGSPVFGERKTTALPGQVIVVEGIHGLNPALTTDISDEEAFRVYIAPQTEPKIDEKRKIQTSDIRKLRRIIRDNAHRGWNAEVTLKSWESVRNGEMHNILPYKDNADVNFDSSLVYELAALKNYAEPLLEAIPMDNPVYPEAQRQLDILSNVKGLSKEAERMIANNSLLREFIGGSIIV